MPDENTLEVIPPNALEAITRGEIDVQIATAHRFPRSLTVFKTRALEMVAMDEETAASCIYSRPVGKEKDEKTGKWVEKYAEGLSVRTAEIVGACYGNLRVGAMVIEQTERFVKARGFAHDLESNFASSSEVIESTVTKEGVPFSERMRVVIAKSCVAKARRDATFQVVPKALCKCLEEEARRIAIGDATTLSKRRDAVMGWINKLGIPVGRVFAALGIQGPDEIGLDQLATLTGIKTAIKDGDVKIDDAFPELREDIRMPSAKKPEQKADPGPAAGEEKAKSGPSDPPPFVADTPQKQLALALSDAGCKESIFLATLKKHAKKLVADAVTIASLSDEAANEALKDINHLLAACEGK